MLDCPDLAVPREVMQHVVHVESSRNPFAIGVVGGYLARQPRNLEEALATVRQLKEDGYNFSVGVSQVNRYNLVKYGVRTYAEAFEVCPNLQAGSRILRECYDRAQDWGKAFSCYYSGNFVTGFEHGYVQKIFASIRRSQNEPSVQEAIRVISYGNGQRKPVRDDGLAMGVGVQGVAAFTSVYPEPGPIRKTMTVASAVMDTVEARPAIPVPGPGAVMLMGMDASRSKSLDLSQIPTQWVGANRDPSQTKVLPAAMPSSGSFVRGQGQPSKTPASDVAKKGGSLLGANESSGHPENPSDETKKGVAGASGGGRKLPSDQSFVF